MYNCICFILYGIILSSPISISSGIIHLTASQSSGQLQSPNYPDNYPVNTECVWTINGPGNEQVQLDFPVAIDMQHAGKYVRLMRGTVNAIF